MMHSWLNEFKPLIQIEKDVRLQIFKKHTSSKNNQGFHIQKVVEIVPKIILSFFS